MEGVVCFKVKVQKGVLEMAKRTSVDGYLGVMCVIALPSSLVMVSGAG